MVVLLVRVQSGPLDYPHIAHQHFHTQPKQLRTRRDIWTPDSVK